MIIKTSFKITVYFSLDYFTGRDNTAVKKSEEAELGKMMPRLTNKKVVGFYFSL